ncbi:MAG: chorismate synthase [Deltaproteobacteria bacterium]|nr:chorismate synthase [Deltaproteobacteria bacterium]
MNGFGRLFRLSLFGASHGPGVGVLVEGCPAGLDLSPEDFSADLQRRRPGAKGTTTRVETDEVQVLSGVHEGKTTGQALGLWVVNRQVDSEAYADIKDLPRPGHADFTAWAKYGAHRDHRGGGMFSGRMTVGLVLAGVIAKRLLPDVQMEARLLQVGGREDMQLAVEEAMAEADSVGGLIECRVKGLPLGLGEPFFDSVESLLAHMLFSIGGIRGVEFGSGFACASMRGSVCNDPILDIDGRTATNHAGGINGGITNGNDLFFRVAVKPTPSIPQAQQTINLSTGHPAEIKIKGRHDACFALRLPIVIEAACAIVLADLQNRGTLAP